MKREARTYARYSLKTGYLFRSLTPLRILFAVLIVKQISTNMDPTVK